VSFSIIPGETLAIVGESGSGKSVTSLSIMRLLPKGTGEITRGSIRLRGRELTTLSEREMRAIRGKDMGMIFQEPMTSLNPVHTIGQQIAEVLLRHERLSVGKAHERADRHARPCRHPRAQEARGQLPHEMSGACASAL
jgi:peptide/nickel transport system ATP-binding protein/oligopeptide transport system ATP-binding protein